MSPKAVIFDMDGVIVDSEPLWREAEMTVFAKYGYTLTEDMCRSTAGLKLSQVIEHWQHVFGYSNNIANELLNQVNDTVIALIQSKGKPFEGLNALLEALQNCSIQIGLASGSSYKIIYTVLDKFGIRPYFKVVRSGEDEEYGKPHPQIFINTATQLGVDVVDCLVIEDSRNGVLAAKAARMRVVAMPEPEVEQDAIFGIANARVKHLTEIITLLA